MRFKAYPHPGAPTPFEGAEDRFFIYGSGPGDMTRLFGDETSLSDRDLLGDHFRMGGTTLWLLERAALQIGDDLRQWVPLPRPPLRWPLTAEPRHRYYLFGDDGSRRHYHHDLAGAWVFGYATVGEAIDDLGHADLAGAEARVVARLIDQEGWH